MDSSNKKPARKRPEDLRSQQWLGRQDRSRLKGKGLPDDAFDGRPVIGICNTFSELTPCNSHFRTLAEQVKIGVYNAGGVALEFPVMSLGETLLRPTAMLYRNLVSMDVEESIRGNPIDGVVLLMGACSVDLPGNAGRRVVGMAHNDQKLSSILTRQAFENAIHMLAAIGGSTSAVIHLVAIAGRIGVPLTLNDFDTLASHLPCLLNLQPSGEHLMEDFCYAGGLPVVMKEIAHLLHTSAVTANGCTLGQNIASAENFDRRVIKTVAEPFKDCAGIAGN